MKSALFSFIMYQLIGYRKKVVTANIDKCFPKKSGEEKKKIIRRFYRNLTDIFFESAKGMHSKPSRLIKRYHLTNPESVRKYFDAGRDIIVLPTHSGNWEWGMQCFNLLIPHRCVALYLPLTNKFSENYGVKKRTRTGMKLVPVQNTRSAFDATSDTPRAFIMAADQSPSNLSKSYWVSFLNQPTACLHGPESYARRYNMPLFFLDITRIKRSRYEISLKEIPFSAESDPKGTATCRYFKLLENHLREVPDDWLWSHRRWKHKVPENINEILVKC